jgi:hypothetical protein
MTGAERAARYRAGRAKPQSRNDRVVRDAKKIAAIIKAAPPGEDEVVPDYVTACYDVGGALYACMSNSYLPYFLALGILEADERETANPPDDPETRSALKAFLRLATIDGKPIEPRT